MINIQMSKSDSRKSNNARDIETRRKRLGEQKEAAKNKLFKLYRDHKLMEPTPDKQLTKFINTLSITSIEELSEAIVEQM